MSHIILVFLIDFGESQVMSALSTPDEAAITRSIDVDRDTATDHLSIHDFDIFYDIQQTVLGIQEGDYKRV